MSDLKSTVHELSANAKAALAGVQGLAFVIVLAGVVFGDVAFIWMFQDAFPTGIFRIASYIGVFATTLSVVGLFIGKSVWFRPGAQIIAAWIFAAIEAFVIVVNTIAAFSVARSGGQIDPALSMWITYVSPATPLIAVIGWFLISWFSPSRAMAHKRMEMEDKLAEEEIAFELATGRAQLELKRQYLKAGQAYMHQELAEPHMLKQVQQAAADEMADVLSSMTGKTIIPRRVARFDDLIEMNGNGKHSKNGN